MTAAGEPAGMVVEPDERSPELADDFADDRGEGTVIGSSATSGQPRLGVDRENALSIDNGALRIAPLIEAGFGRAAITYGPFSRRAGLAFSVSVLNGHNTAQAGQLPETFRDRIALWLRGSGADPRWRRVVRWLSSGRVRRTVRQFRWWRRTAKDAAPVPLLDENLSAGWFPVEVVPDPRREGSGFIMHALGPENGELWTGADGCRTRSLRGVQNLPLYLVGILRPEGMVYYASSIDGAPGIASHPRFSPVALERGVFAEELYLGIQQGVLGQIGWRMDTRVKGVRIAHVRGYESWWGGAHAADRLAGDGDLPGMPAEPGGAWRVVAGEVRRGPAGASSAATEALAILNPASPTGLVHAVVSPGAGDRARVGLVWRFLDERNHWRLEVGRRGYAVLLVVEGVRQTLAAADFPEFLGKRPRRLQVIDDGRYLTAFVDGEPVTDGSVEDTRLGGATGVGILLDAPSGEQGTMNSFEAHPRSIELPAALAMASPWYRKGVHLAVADDFAGPAEDLEGRPTPIGDRRWRRVIGRGIIETTGTGTARVRGSVQEPCPGRTAYCFDWVRTDFADLEVVITPPGTRRGEKERTMAGFILFQDQDNYVTLNTWRGDSYGGASISTFFKFGGFEDLYDAVWTNVGDRVSYGRPTRLRLCCDGERYLAFLNDEPVLYRGFRDVYPSVDRLRICKVGLLANWEFGNDTGSQFEQFRARY